MIYLTYLELYKIICEPWISISGIRQIARCSRDTAINIRNNIERQIINSGKNLPNCKTRYVPTRLVLEYLCLDEEYISQMAMQEKKMM